MRALALLLLLGLLAPVTPALAVPPVDPPLTYALTVYDRDPSRLASDGTTVYVIRAPRERERLGLSPFSAPCGVATVVGGRAEVRVEITADCPEGMFALFGLADLPGGGISAASEPPLVWRRAYSESTTTVELVVRPVPPRE
jgi:hypothetical protein